MQDKYSAITEKLLKYTEELARKRQVNAVCRATLTMSATGIITEYVTACDGSVFALYSVYASVESNNT